MSTKITPSNCIDLQSEEMYTQMPGTIAGKAAAWSVVYNFCLQNGMEKLPQPASGIETVITFIDNLLKDKK
jgi:hypothetical protein